MSILASIGERVVHHRKFPGVARTFRGNRRDESSSPNRPVKRTTVRLAKTNCKQSGSQQFQNFKATRGRVRTPKLRETGFTFSTISHAMLWSVVSPRTALGQKQDFSRPVCFLAKQTPVFH